MRRSARSDAPSRCQVTRKLLRIPSPFWQGLLQTFVKASHAKRLLFLWASITAVASSVRRWPQALRFVPLLGRVPARCALQTTGVASLVRLSVSDFLCARL